MSSTLTIRDVCERFVVTEHTVLAWIRSGELRAVNVGRAPEAKKPRWRITQAALDAFEPGFKISRDQPAAQVREEIGS